MYNNYHIFSGQSQNDGLMSVYSDANVENAVILPKRMSSESRVHMQRNFNGQMPQPTPYHLRRDVTAGASSSSS
ncbi:hypothetical protein DPMN_172719 [Dreissena polymorpha]|uniref:Uncharacterized protein n=1 Tax=Dreissena polymorpha TaxID=45954 RepID=A0A9D4E0B7_DREPO|nr:hypothetical protein DPMN_172719 [Dreissena polymorpha]